MNVPNTSDDENPVKNRVETLTPYPLYKVYMFVPCSQSASMITKYTARYSRWNALNSLTLPLVCLVTLSVVGVVAVFKRRMPSSMESSSNSPQNRFESGAGQLSGNKEARSLNC